MSRKTDLERHIRDSYALICEYERILQNLSDPKEKARSRREMEEQWTSIEGYLAEYRRLAGVSWPEDIAEIAAHFPNEGDQLLQQEIVAPPPPGFLYHGPLPPDSPLFRGREKELSRIKDLCQGELRSFLMILGGRQTGKTSLLLRIPGLLGTQCLACRVDMERVPGAAKGRVYGYIATQVAAQLPSAVGMRPSPPPELDPDGLSSFVRQVVRQIAPNKLVLLFEKLDTVPPESREALANLLRSWFTARFDAGCREFGRIMVILAGSAELYHLAATEVSPLRNVSELIYLPDLTETEAVDLIPDGLGYLGFPVDNRVRRLGEAVFKLVGGHPSLTQCIGSAIGARGPNNLPAEGDIPQLGYQAVIDGSLTRHLWHALGEFELWEAIPDLLSGQVRFSRFDEQMALLEQLGLATERNGNWAVRNALLERILNEWLAQRAGRPPESARPGSKVLS